MRRRVGSKELLQRLKKRCRMAEQAHRDQLEAADQLNNGMRRQSDVIILAYQLASGTPSKPWKGKVAMQRSYETDSPYTLQLRDLIDRVRYGDEAAMIDLKALLDRNPDFWHEIGDLARHVESNWIKFLAADPVLQESLKRECLRRRAELLGDDPTSIERHLVEMIVSSWLQLQHAEIEMANSAGASEKKLNFLHRRLESAQKQHLAAMTQLVKVREAARKAKKQKSVGSTGKSGRKTLPRKGAHRRVVAV